MIGSLAALRWCEGLVALAIALQTLELLAARHALGDDAALGWALVRGHYVGTPALVRRALDALLAPRPFAMVLGLQLGAAVALGCGAASAIAAPLLVASCFCVSVRFAGPYNGGSDAMTMVVLLGASLARLGDDERSRQIGLGYVAAQLVLSYLVAGLAKLRRRPWRDGRALQRLLAAGSYAVPALPARALAKPGVARAASWAVIALECGFPLALFERRACIALLALGAIFHASNGYLLGLNRFLWAWLAAYPALYYWAALRG